MSGFTTKQLLHKFDDGTEELVNIAVNAENVEEINFEQAEVLENIKPREGILVIFGKLMKWYSSLKNVAWTGSYDDIGDKPKLDEIEGILSLEKGGTGANNAKTARDNLGLGTAATYGVATTDKLNDSTLLANATITYQHGVDIESLKRAFLDGVNKIYDKLDGLGFTPADSSPDAICDAIQNVYDKRYEDGIKISSCFFDSRGGGPWNYTAIKSGILHISASSTWVNSEPGHNNTGIHMKLYKNGVCCFDRSWRDHGYNEDSKDGILSITYDLQVNAGDSIVISHEENNVDATSCHVAYSYK